MNVFEPSRNNLLRCAEILQSGELAILPTETVYGLAADASNESAIAKVFALKGRPADNPLIVHVSSLDQVSHFAASIPDSFAAVASAFMPGPLTVIFQKRAHVSDLLTGGLDTVAIRMPDHPACLGALELGGLAVAMPSANPFMSLSPTKVEMIDPALAEGVKMVIDGGPCAVGIESTVLDLTGVPTILRPGSISQQDIEDVLKQHVASSGDTKKSPGMYKRHYAPRTPCGVSSNVSSAEAGLVFREPANPNQIQMPAEPKEYATLLYASLADLDRRALEAFFIQAPPQTPEWAAVWDRLTKATA